jgi:type IV secretory pathway TrbL component
MKTLSWLVIGLVLVFGAGCASSSNAPAAATTGPPANVAGSWNGGFYGALSNSVSMQLTQQGTAVSGNIDVGGRSDLSGGIKGTVSGNMFNYSLANGGSGTMQVSGNTISGTVNGNAFRAQKQ